MTRSIISLLLVATFLFAKTALADTRTTVTHITPGPFTGTPVVVDADTLKFGTVRVRLHGIDAPEKTQCCTQKDGMAISCGAIAKDNLVKFLAKRTVTCTVVSIDTRWKRPVAKCYLENGLDLNALLVKAGLAVAAAKYSNDYVDEQAAARSAGHFLWSMGFEDPSAWRQRKASDPDLKTCKAN